MLARIELKGGIAQIEEAEDNKLRIEITPSNQTTNIPRSSIVTSYPLELIQDIARAKETHLCDEIARESDPNYVAADLHYGLLSYITQDDLENGSMLDFGCGMGSSTCNLARMFPRTRIYGVDMRETSIAVARKRALLLGYSNTEFLLSPNPERLPDDVPDVDAVSMTGVYEHLLPNERGKVMRLLWSRLKRDGILFLHQTPHRYFPYETHTTGGLFGVNWLPKRIAMPYVRRFSPISLKTQSWESLLRLGLRGGTVREIVGNLGASASEAVVLAPRYLDADDTIDLWFQAALRRGDSRGKRLAYKAAKIAFKVTKVEVPPYLTIAIRKC